MNARASLHSAGWGHYKRDIRAGHRGSSLKPVPAKAERARDNSRLTPLLARAGSRGGSARGIRRIPRVFLAKDRVAPIGSQECARCDFVARSPSKILGMR